MGGTRALRGRRIRTTAFRVLVAGLAIGFVTLASAGCESRRAAERRAEEAVARAKSGPRIGAGPQALMIRFETRSGTALAREGWELEVLQLGGDARLRGSLRTPDSVIPVGGALTPAEFADLWADVQAMPLDRYRVQEDSTAAAEGWTKRLDVDIVLGPDRRILSRNAWSYPPVGAPWLDELEGLLHALAVEHATIAGTRSKAPDSTREAVGRAVREVMRDLGTPVPGDADSLP